MTLDSAVTSENAHAYHQGCPFLGAEDDSETKFLFATPEGCCHRAQPPEAVIMAHQQIYCLTPQFVKCPVYIQERTKPLPTELRQPLEQEDSASRVGLFIGIVLVIGIGLIWSFLGGGLGFLGEQVAVISGEPTAVTILQPTATATLTATPTASHTPLPTALPTATSSPTPTASPLPTATRVTATATAVSSPTTAASTNTPVSEATPTTTPTPDITAQAIISASRVNIRSGPGIAYPVLEIVEEGDGFEVIGRLNDESWWQICCTTDGESAWVFGEAVLLEGNITSIPLAADIAPPPTDQ